MKIAIICLMAFALAAAKPAAKNRRQLAPEPSGGSSIPALHGDPSIANKLSSFSSQLSSSVVRPSSFVGVPSYSYSNSLSSSYVKDSPSPVEPSNSESSYVPSHPMVPSYSYSYRSSYSHSYSFSYSSASSYVASNQVIGLPAPKPDNGEDSFLFQLFQMLKGRFEVPRVMATEYSSGDEGLDTPRFRREAELSSGSGDEASLEELVQSSGSGDEEPQIIGMPAPLPELIIEPLPELIIEPLPEAPEGLYVAAPVPDDMQFFLTKLFYTLKARFEKNSVQEEIRFED